MKREKSSMTKFAEYLHVYVRERNASVFLFASACCTSSSSISSLKEKWCSITASMLLSSICAYSDAPPCADLMRTAGPLPHLPMHLHWPTSIPPKPMVRSLITFLKCSEPLFPHDFPPHTSTEPKLEAMRGSSARKTLGCSNTEMVGGMMPLNCSFILCMASTASPCDDAWTGSSLGDVAPRVWDCALDRSCRASASSSLSLDDDDDDDDDEDPSFLSLTLFFFFFFFSFFAFDLFRFRMLSISSRSACMFAFSTRSSSSTSPSSTSSCEALPSIPSTLAAHTTSKVVRLERWHFHPS
mmetsp:Transcript_1584/g.9780  ORF Transcript_1584/g.9780 Transcript_1584/m.9780 type:complete len:298 (-) Transcript_1584:245-1138(-)